MEKLIELLNEYDVGVVSREKREYSEITWDMIRWISDDQERLSMADICSKKFWFIKWLVENEKIDLNDIQDCFYVRSYNKEWIAKKYEYYEELLMLLSISDTPIEFLIGILK